MAMTQSEIYSLALSVGLSPAKAKVAAAIAMAESSGNPNAHNPIPPDDSYGLWQINMYKGLGPDRRKQFGLSANSDLFNPATNAKAMASISSKGGNFSAWSTYTNGRYQKYLSAPVADQTKDPGFLETINQWTRNLVGAGAGAVPGVSEAASVAGGVGAIAENTSKAAVWLSNSENWVRIAYVTAGTVVAIAGLVMVMQSTKAGRTATKTAVSVAGKVPV